MRILILVFIIAVFSFSSFADGLRSVHTKDGINIWAAGLNGYMIYSSDGGTTWQNKTQVTSGLNSAFAVQNNVLIAGNGGVLLLSTDNGSTFTQRNISGGVDINSVFMTDNNTGWIAGNSGLVMKTTNGGLNWSPQSTGTASNLLSVKFSDQLNGFCCGTNGKILKTTNGGVNWSASPVPVTNDLYTIDIKSSVIFSFGSNSLGVKSTDNGSTWSIVDYKIQTRQNINSVNMRSPNVYYSCGGGGFIRKTTDGGTSFSYQANPLLSGLNCIFFYDDNNGYAAGVDNNVVLKTTNGGQTWIIPAGVSQSLTWEQKLLGTGIAQGNNFGFSPVNKNTIYFGSGNKIYRSLDIGETWSEFSTLPVGNTVNAVHVSQKDTNLFLVSSCTTVGVSDNALRSTDHGASWVSVFNADFENDSRPINVDPNHPDTVYLCVKNSLIYRSTNFGLNWSSTGPSVLGSVCILKVLDGNSGNLFCGVQAAPSKIYRSTNYALTWEIADTVDAVEVPHIEGSNLAPEIMYASGFFHGLLRSSDFGATWNTIVLNDDLWGLDVAKDDPNVIVHSGSWTGIKPVYISVNGGANFTATQNVQAGGNYALFAYSRNCILGQYSSRVMKLKVSYNLPIGINPISTEIPTLFRLYQNYPNPFNPVTKIRFDVPVSAFTQIRIYNVTGNEVSAPVSEILAPGSYSVNWNAGSEPSGVYFCKITSGSFSKTTKLVLLK